MRKTPVVMDPAAYYHSTDDGDILKIINFVREGLKFSNFLSITKKSPFSLSEWSGFLHLSERTMQRYKREKKTFDALHSEKIIQISFLFHKGVEVFGSNEKFNSWLEIENLSLGKLKPRDLLDSAFGLGLLTDELLRIEHGVLA
jgi:putative toxin-antitoxin system antitoxin component (TIGR02293 family)